MSEDREWKDGDDTALYEQGYSDGINQAISVIDTILKQPNEALQLMPSEYTLKIIRHSILHSED